MLFCWLRFQRADSPEQALHIEHICNWQKTKMFIFLPLGKKI